MRPAVGGRWRADVGSVTPSSVAAERARRERARIQLVTRYEHS